MITDGEECPVYLWWPVLSEEDYDKSYLLIYNLDDETNCVARRLNLSRRNFINEKSNCLANFNWRGIYTIYACIQYVIVARTLIGVHELHGQMYPIYGIATILLAHNPLSSLACPMITHTPPVASNLRIKTLVTRQWPTSIYMQ